MQGHSTAERLIKFDQDDRDKMIIAPYSVSHWCSRLVLCYKSSAALFLYSGVILPLPKIFIDLRVIETLIYTNDAKLCYTGLAC